MKATIHVDYLSHDWSPNDVIRAHAQTRKHLRSTSQKLHSDPSNRAVRLEHQRLIRFQNALWRQMSRTCTCRLGRDNPLVNPSTVNWQKESDITWLYGPLYTTENEQSSSSSPSSSSSIPNYHTPHGLKPALKKQSTALYVRRGVEDDRIPSFSSISSTSTANSSIFPSLPSTPPSPVSHSTGVRFSPESTKVQYFEPESPVQESLGYEDEGVLPKGWNPYWSIYDEQDNRYISTTTTTTTTTTTSRYHYYYYGDDDYYYGDDEQEDDALWESMVSVVDHVKSLLSSWLTPRWPRKTATLPSSPPPQQQQRPSTASRGRKNPTAVPATSLDLMMTLMSVTKSVASLVATWLMYQSLLRIVRRPSSIRQAVGKRDNAITWQTFPS